MDYQMGIEIADGYNNYIPNILEKLKETPCLELKTPNQLPVVNLGNQFWHAMRRELEILIPFAK